MLLKSFWPLTELRGRWLESPNSSKKTVSSAEFEASLADSAISRKPGLWHKKVNTGQKIRLRLLFVSSRCPKQQEIKKGGQMCDINFAFFTVNKKEVDATVLRRKWTQMLYSPKASAATMGGEDRGGPSRLFLNIGAGRDWPPRLFDKSGSGSGWPPRSWCGKVGIGRD